MSITLPGWSCPACGVFNGEEKERRIECRSCVEPRPLIPIVTVGFDESLPRPCHAEFDPGCMVCRATNELQRLTAEQWVLREALRQALTWMGRVIPPEGPERQSLVDARRRIISAGWSVLEEAER